MSDLTGFIITTAGEGMLAHASAGDTLTITGVQVGSGAVQDETAAKALTALIAPEQVATSSGPIVADGQVQMLVEYRNDLNGGLEAGFTLAEFGIFAKIGDEQPALLFYAALGEGAQPVQPIADGLDVHRFPVAWTVTDGVSVTLSYPPGAFVSANEKGVPNGVATLGADGKVPEAQLPDMGGIMLSGVGGVSVMPASANWRGVVYGAGKYVMAGTTSEDVQCFAYSSDGINWAEITPSPFTVPVRAMANNGSIFVALSYVTAVGGSNIAYYSTDGLEWTQTTLPSAGLWYDVAYGNGKFIAINKSNNTVAYSTDGILWTQGTTLQPGDWRNLAFGNGRFVVFSVNNDASAYSDDGQTWTPSTIPSGPNWTNIEYGAGKFVLISNDPTNSTAYSTDGISWTANPNSIPDVNCNWTNLEYGNEIFVATASNGDGDGLTPSPYIMYSMDGVNWTAIKLPVSLRCNWITYGADKFVVSAYGNISAFSTDGINWTSHLVDGDGADVTAQVRAALDMDAVDVSVPDDTAAALDIPAGSTVNDALLAAGALKSRAVTATLTAAGWTGSGPWTQTVTVSGLTSTSNGVVGPTTGVTDTQFEAMQKACLRPSAQSTNSLTIKATGTKPTINLPIQIIIVG